MSCYIKQLREIEQAATPAPRGYDGVHDEITCEGEGYWLIISCLREHPEEKITDEFGHAYNPNFELIATARNALPALLDEMERLRAENRRLKQERDAAISDVKKYCPICSTCKHDRSNQVIPEDSPCLTCRQLYNGKTRNWEWRGVRKNGDE